MAFKDRLLFSEAAAVAGCGPLEERLVRLMIWIGTTLRSTRKHSLLQHPLEIWRDGTAWCDQHCRVFCYVVWHLLGLQARQLALTHENRVDGHTVCEVFYGERWHLFDVHSDHLAVYRAADGHIMSNDELRADPDVVGDQEHWWRGTDGGVKRGFFTAKSSFRIYAVRWTVDGPPEDPPIDGPEPEPEEAPPQQVEEPQQKPESP